MGQKHGSRLNASSAVSHKNLTQTRKDGLHVNTADKNNRSDIFGMRLSGSLKEAEIARAYKRMKRKAQHDQQNSPTNHPGLATQLRVRSDDPHRNQGDNS